MKFKDLKSGDRLMLQFGDSTVEYGKYVEYAVFVKFTDEYNGAHPIFRSFTTGGDAYEWSAYREDGKWCVDGERLRIAEVLGEPKHARPESNDLAPGTVIVEHWLGGDRVIGRIVDPWMTNTIGFSAAPRTRHRAKV